MVQQTNISEIPVLLLSAGFGTRLKPLTDTTPKPLITVGGKPLIVWHLERLRREGFGKVFVNAHYLADQLVQFLGDGSAWGLEVEVVREDPILDTGGAIKNIAHKIKAEQLVVVNSDAFFAADFSLAALCMHHWQRGGLATLVVRESADAAQFGLIGLDQQDRIVKFLDAGDDAGVVKQVMFAGAQVLEKETFSYLDSFGIISSLTKDLYRFLISEGKSLNGRLYGGYWNDVGTVQRLAEVEQFLKNS